MQSNPRSTTSRFVPALLASQAWFADIAGGDGGPDKEPTGHQPEGRSGTLLNWLEVPESPGLFALTMIVPG